MWKFSVTNKYWYERIFYSIINIYLRKIKNCVEKVDSSVNYYNKKINEIINHNIVKLTESLNVFIDRKEVQNKKFNLEKEWTKTNFINSEVQKELKSPQLLLGNNKIKNKKFKLIQNNKIKVLLFFVFDEL